MPPLQPAAEEHFAPGELELGMGGWVSFEDMATARPTTPQPHPATLAALLAVTTPLAAAPAALLVALLTILLISTSLHDVLPDFLTRTRWFLAPLFHACYPHVRTGPHTQLGPSRATVTESMANVGALRDHAVPPCPRSHPLPLPPLSQDAAAAADSPSSASSDDDGFSSPNEDDGDAASLALELAHAPGPG